MFYVAEPRGFVMGVCGRGWSLRSERVGGELKCLVGPALICFLRRYGARGYDGFVQYCAVFLPFE